MMKLRRLIPGFLFLAVVSFFLVTVSCSKDNDDHAPEPKPADCSIILFDGDHFKDDSVVLKGSGEYPDLNNLPNTDKKWDDEADSFIAGENAVATFYSKPNFKGDSVVYDAGAQEASVDEPRSIKIKCLHKMDPMDD